MPLNVTSSPRQLGDGNSQSTTLNPALDAAGNPAKLSFFGATPVVQPSPGGNISTPAAGSGTQVYVNTTFDGGIGTTAYTAGDVVAALKSYGLLPGAPTSGVFLGSLGLSSTTFTVGTPSSGTITGATASSTITGTGFPTGFSINGAARTWAYDGTGSVTTGNILLTETLAGATNSPKTTTIGYSVVAASSLSAGTIAFDTANGWTSGENPPQLSITLPNDGTVELGDYVCVEHSQNSFSTSLFTAWQQITFANVINSAEGTGYQFIWDTSTLPAGSTSFRSYFGRGADSTHITLQSPASNIITDTLNTPQATITMTNGAYNVASHDKARFTVVPSPNYQVICQSNTSGGMEAVRSNKAATNADFYLEYQIDGFGASGYIVLGVDGGGTDLSVTPADAKPGESSPGFTVGFGKAATTLYGYWNGSETTAFTGIPTGGMLAGDRIGFAYHGSVANPVVSISHIRSGTVTRLGTKTLTSQIATSVYPVIMVYVGNGTAADGSSDCVTLKPKTTDWTGTPPSDGVTYTFAA